MKNLKQDNSRKKLNSAQSEAVAHNDGPCLVLAGPGSGKTLTVVKRVKRLLEEKKAVPDEILVITFTKYAAREMKERFWAEMDGKKLPVTFGTFHGIYYGILKWAYRLGPSNILSEEEKYQILGHVASFYELDAAQEQDFLTNLSSEIGVVKNSRYKIEEYEAKSCPVQSFREIYKDYEKKRKELKKIDFDDMLELCCQLFEKRPDLLKLWQDKFRYILVDEFQDINQIQYDVIKMLAAPQNNLFVVGDEDQSIYGFRGAKAELMFQFEKDYPAAKRIVLNENYRSTGNIVRCANRVIKNNQMRYEKQIKAVKPDGDTLHVQEVKDPKEEAAYLADEIEKELKKGRQEEDIAVLFRTKNETAPLVEELSRRRISFWMREQIFNIYHHFIGENIASYFKMALGDRSRRTFLNVMNRPKRYLSRESLGSEEVSFEELRNFYCDKSWMLDRIDQLDVDLRILNRMTPYGAIQYLKKSVGYVDFLKEYAEQNKRNAEDFFEILYQIESQAKEFKTLEEWLNYREEYTLSLKILQQKMDRTAGSGIQLMTLHGAKGLEYPVVFLPEANETILPHRKSRTKEELEEERRLFYVGMTRAKERLVISYCVTKNGNDLTPSRFVDEIFSVEE